MIMLLWPKFIESEKSLRNDFLIATKNLTYIKDVYHRQRMYHNTRHHNLSNKSSKSNDRHFVEQTTGSTGSKRMLNEADGDGSQINKMNPEHFSLLHNITSGTINHIKAKGSIRKRTPADDVLSKNISFLLENLLKRYENSHLPTHGQGEITFLNNKMYTFN